MCDCCVRIIIIFPTYPQLVSTKDTNCTNIRSLVSIYLSTKSFNPTHVCALFPRVRINCSRIEDDILYVFLVDNFKGTCWCRWISIVINNDCKLKEIELVKWKVFLKIDIVQWRKNRTFDILMDWNGWEIAIFVMDNWVF